MKQPSSEFERVGDVYEMGFYTKAYFEGKFIGENT